jgi:putative ABC transport system substrate-binding protein
MARVEHGAETDGWLVFARRRRSPPALAAQEERLAGERLRGSAPALEMAPSIHATESIAILMVLLALGVLTVPLGGEAQEAGKVARIGILRQGSPPDPNVEVFKQGLRELGYVEGRNISIEYRWAEGKDERLRGLAADLVRLQVKVIVATGSAAVAAKQATNAISIVMPAITDPVRLGLVSSLARPGGNVTGFATQNEQMPGKWMELVKETLPRLSRVAVVWQPTYDGGVQLKASEVAARSLGLHLQALKVEGPDDLMTAFAQMQKNRAEALIVSSSALFYVHRARLVELAAKHRLPTIYYQSEFVVGSGGLMSYGTDFHDLFRRSATYVDKILRGAKPGDLPVQQPTKFELVINRRTAKALGLTIPQSLLLRADQVIE